MEITKFNSCGIGKIVHARNKDTKNYFSYNAPYLLLNLKELPIHNKIFSMNSPSGRFLFNSTELNFDEFFSK